MMPGITALLIVFKLWVGALVGCVVASLAYRSRFSKALLLRGALLGAAAFLVASSAAEWLGSGPAPGQQSWIGSHETAISYIASFLAALLAGWNMSGAKTGAKAKTSS